MSPSLALLLQDTLAGITPLTPQCHAEGLRRLDQLTKPPGSLGRLEQIGAQCYAITEGKLPVPMRKGAYLFAADHGVSVEGVSAYPTAVTAQMVHNFLTGGAAVNVLARLHDVTLTIVDVGVDAEFPDHPQLWRLKVRRGSRNLRREPALCASELEQALRIGIHAADDAARRNLTVLAAGEMGIGNTTAASAITAALTGMPPAAVTGTGTGIAPATRSLKQRVIEEALARHLPDGDGEPHAPLEILRCLGGLEIAAMCGFFLGAARWRRIIVVDGFIATTAAALAVALAPAAREYMIAGHRSEEPGHTHLLNHLGLAPLLELEMRLGEGTGALAAMPLVEAAVHLLAQMATFESAGVSTAAS